MNYPTEFIKECKEVYPDWKELHKALESGNDFVGRYLCDAAQQQITPTEVYLKITSKEVDSLLEKAEKLLKQQDLWVKWCKLKGYT